MLHNIPVVVKNRGDVWVNFLYFFKLRYDQFFLQKRGIKIMSNDATFREFVKYLVACGRRVN